MHNVCVMARVRPPKSGMGNYVNVNSNKNYIDINEMKKGLMNNNIETAKRFNFDEVYDKDYTNDDLFNDFGMKITFNLIKNIDTTFYVYGQTGSGKTYTIMGTDRVPGLLKLIISVLKKQSTNITFNCIQIYNNKCLDILNNNLEIFEREDNNGKIHLSNVKNLNLKTQSAENIINLVKKNRHVGVSNQNDQSSRSHLLFRFNNGKNFLNILDLAGSEKANDSIYVNKDVFRENAEINKSILVLKECIRSLKNNDSHIPYRGSKLTKILKDSFERRTESYILATVSPEKENINDSINTLNYISDIKLIKRKFNEVPDKKELPIISEVNNKLKKSISEPKINEDKKFLPPVIKRDISQNIYSNQRPPLPNNNQLPQIHNQNQNSNVNFKQQPDYRRFKKQTRDINYNTPYKEINKYNAPNGLSPNCRLLMNNRYKMENLNKEKERIISLIARRRTSSQTKNKLVGIINDEIKLLSQLKNNIL